MYYLIEKSDGFYIKEIEEPTTDGTYHELKRQGYEMRGQFGRLDYAEIWRDFYNNKISREELKQKLN